MSKKEEHEKMIIEVHQKTVKKYTAEEKIRIVPEVLQGESSITKPFHREGVNTNMCHK